MPNKQVTQDGGILGKCEPGDSIMADKGFNIDKLCQERSLLLNIPPFLGKDAQLSAGEMVDTKRIASLRVHVERAVERVNIFHILDHITSPWYGMASTLVFVCANLRNFQPCLVRDNEYNPVIPVTVLCHKSTL